MAREKVAIVTDTTCDAPREHLEQMGVHVVALKVIAADGTELADDASEESLERYYDYIVSCDELPGTSMPSPLQFADLYTELAKEGYTGIVSLHISSGLSGTCSAANMAAQSAAIPVEVVDSHNTTWPMELILRRLVRLRDGGAGLAEIADAARGLANKASVCFAANTLRNLAKSGRVHGAVALAAGVLDIKPIIVIDDEGKAVMGSKAKSMRRAIDKMARMAADLVKKLGPLEGYFLHVRNLEDANSLREAFKKYAVDFNELGVHQVGPVVTTHVAVGCVGFAYIPREA